MSLATPFLPATGTRVTRFFSGHDVKSAIGLEEVKGLFEVS